MHAGEFDELAVGELERAHIERVRFAVLGEFRSDHAIAAAAIIGSVIVDALERRAQRTHGRRHILAHPPRDRLGEFAAHDRGRRHRHAGLVGEHDGFEPDHVLGATASRAGHSRQRRRNRQLRGQPQEARRWRRRFVDSRRWRFGRRRGPWWWQRNCLRRREVRGHNEHREYATKSHVTDTRTNRNLTAMPPRPLPMANGAPEVYQFHAGERQNRRQSAGLGSP